MRLRETTVSRAATTQASAIGKDERRERCSAEIAIADDDRSTSAARNSHIRNVD
jgi:hypothetical protein